MAANIGVLTIRGLEDMFVPILKKCLNMADLKKTHAQIVKFSLSQSNFLVTKMVEACDKNGETDYASLLFNQVIQPNLFLFNAMIKAYTNAQMYDLALNNYKQLLKHPPYEHPKFPNKFTYPFVIRSCGGLKFIDLGKQIHGHINKFGLKSNTVIENSLLDMYVKCDDLNNAHNLFDEMLEPDEISWNCLISGHIKMGEMRKARTMFEQMKNKTVVSWTTMISGYARIRCYGDALDVFRTMQISGIKPDWISLVAVLHACAQLGDLEVGNWVHFYADKNGFLKKISVCNALIEMYAKCGSLNQAQQLFNEMPEQDVVCWSTMIFGLANHGKAREAIELFQQMKKTKVKPNEITFVGILSACVHAGCLDEGLKQFNSMKNDYQIEPGIEHYGCVIDLLARNGLLERAFDLIQTMPVKPDAAIWGSLLSSCRTHRNLEIAIKAMEKLEEIEPGDIGNYVLLANIYADLRKWDGVTKMWRLIRSSKSMKRTPGCSLIEVNDSVQEFVSADRSKPFSKEIYGLLGLLIMHQNDDEAEQFVYS